MSGLRCSSLSCYNAAMPLADIMTVWEGIEDVPAFLYACAMVIAGLVLIEGLLSVDNALGIAAMAAHLPKEQQKPALRWGLVGAYLFRGIALALVAWLMHNAWVKWFGAVYLIYLASEHLQLHPPHKKQTKDPSARTVGKSFLMTIVSIELMDLSLSLDNVVAAVGMVNGVSEIPHELHIWVVCIGVFIGIAALRIVAGWCIGIIEHHPILSYTAFLLVGFVGAALCVEMGLAALGTPWHMGIVLKFCNITFIVILSLLYERVTGVRRCLHPLVHAFRACCTGFTWLVESIIMPWRLFRRS